MNTPLDDQYLEWLYEQVGRQGSVRRRTHWKLLKQLYATEFEWMVPNDDNRVEDGRELRYEFVTAARLPRVEASWMGLGCSVLEMLIALSRRLSFEAEGEPRDWFWTLMANLDLDQYNDAEYDGFITEIDKKLRRLVMRQYRRDGKGGLFPLNHPEKDQRDVEIWYQLSAYLIENE